MARGLGEAVIERTPTGTRDIGQQTIEDLPTLFVFIKTLIEEMA